MPVTAPETLTLAISGPRFLGSSTKLNLSGSGAKTSKVTFRWDTPTSPDSFASWATNQRQACSLREKLAQVTGVAASSSWPTPTASDAGYVPDMTITDGALRLVSPFDISEGSGGQFALNEAARTWTTLWYTMKAVGWNAASATPAPSPQVRVSFKHGSGSFVSGLTPNPRFYEQMMGWPIGWTAPGEPVTEFAAWLQQSRGQFSRLLTSWTIADPTSD